MKDEHAKKDQQELHDQIGQLTNQLAFITAEDLKLRDKVTQGFRDISYEFSTNAAVAPSIRLAILNNAQENLSKEQVELQKNHELLPNAAVDMKTLRAERESQLALQENRMKQTIVQQIVQQEIANIQKNKDAEEAAKRAEQLAKNQKWADEELIKVERKFAIQILPTFDYAIAKLNGMLSKISTETQQRVYSDFSGESPTIHASALVKDGLIVIGTNTISLGTNAAWGFKISTIIAPLHASPEMPPQPPDFIANSIAVNFGPHYTRLEISCQTTKGESTLIIEPVIPWNADIGYRFVPNRDSRFYTQFSIKLSLPNGLKLDETQPAETCNPTIDKALRYLIEAQDQQFPLTSKPGH